MYKFTALKTLHEDMKVKKEERAIFPFSYNKKDFSCIFLTDIKPMKLYLATLGSKPIVFEIKINKEYCTNAFFDDYKKLIDYLELKYNPNHTFKPKDFFEALNKKIPNVFRTKPRYSEVVRVLSNRTAIEEKNKIYFCSWRQNAPGARVSNMNLEKTRTAFGDKFANMCKLKNVSSCWTDNPSDEVLNKINNLSSM